MKNVKISCSASNIKVLYANHYGDMKKRIFAVVFALFVSFQCVEGETNGYLSFEYSRNLKTVENNNTFQNTQLGLIFSGSLTPGIGYLTELSLHEGQVETEQAWLSFFSSESFRLKMGLFLVPFGKYNQNSRPHETFLIHTPLNIAHSFPLKWRDIGLVIEGRIGNFVYELFTGNGLSEGMNLNDGQQFIDNNENKGFGGRLGWFLAQSFEVAYSFYRGKVDSTNERKNVFQCVDVTWSTESFKVLGEYTQGEIENPMEFPKGTTDGYFIQASISLQKIHPVVSYQKLNYSDPFHGSGFVSPNIKGEGINFNQNRWAFGIVYIPTMNVLLKLEYDIDKDESMGPKKRTLTLQAALSF